MSEIPLTRPPFSSFRPKDSLQIYQEGLHWAGFSPEEIDRFYNLFADFDTRHLYRKKKIRFHLRVDLKTLLPSILIRIRVGGRSASNARFLCTNELRCFFVCPERCSLDVKRKALAARDLSGTQFRVSRIPNPFMTRSLFSWTIDLPLFAGFCTRGNVKLVSDACRFASSS